MKTIKIFLASSEELKDERLEMTDLVSRLNQTFKGRGIQLELKRWEYLDSSMGEQRKQDEYNDVLRECDICLVLFWRRFGSYTGEELDVAYQCYKNKHKPEKIYVFFKNPDDDDVTTELKEFIKSYESRYGGHFFNKFLTIDSLKLEFLLQFELYQKDQLGEKAIEVRNEHVYVDNEMVADLNNIPFAANNEGFKKRQAELKELEEKIEQKRKELDEKNAALQLAKDQQANLPDVAGLQMFVDMAQKAVTETEDGLQELLNSKNQLKDEFEREQQNLFNTARRITEQRGQKISERMARAIEAFESGDAQRADFILDEAERDFEEARKDFRITKKVSVQALEEQIKRASYKMSNDSIPIEERVAKTLYIYEEADVFAQEISYDQKKYISFLWDYSEFLHDHAHYDKTIEIQNKLIKMCEDFYGKEHPDTAATYNNIGTVYGDLGNYDKASEYYKQAVEIQEKVQGKEHPDTADSYNNIGNVYYHLGNYDKALEYHKQALEIREKAIGKEHPDTAKSYNNIGLVYNCLGNNEKALEYHKLALDIQEKVLGMEHPDTAKSYNNIGNVYYSLGNYDNALKYHKQTLDIREKVLGKKHPDTAYSYGSIGLVYKDLGNYDKALEYLKQTLDIQEKVLGKEHPDTAISYNNIGIVYKDLDNYDKALEYHKLALKIQEKVLGKEHPGTASSFNNIGLVYNCLGNYDKALEYHKLALEIKEKVLGNEHPDTANTYNYIGLVYNCLGNYDKALEYYKQALEIQEKVLGNEHPDTADSYNIIGNVYYHLGNYEKALEYHKLALKIQEKVLGKEHPDTAGTYNNIGFVYNDIGNYDKSLEYYILAAEQGYKCTYNELAWTLHLMCKYEEALPWAEKAVKSFPDSSACVDTLACVYEDLGRNQEALEKFELCLRLLKEQKGQEERIKETKEKIAALKELMKSNS